MADKVDDNCAESAVAPASRRRYNTKTTHTHTHTHTGRSSRHHTSSDPAHTRDGLRQESGRPRPFPSALIGRSSDAAAPHWLRGGVLYSEFHRCCLRDVTSNASNVMRGESRFADCGDFLFWLLIVVCCWTSSVLSISLIRFDNEYIKNKWIHEFNR